MSRITKKQKLENAKHMRDEWLNAEKAVMAGQSYSIDGKSVTKAPLSEIRKSISYWEHQIKILGRKSKGRGSVRVTNIVPMG